MKGKSLFWQYLCYVFDWQEAATETMGVVRESLSSVVDTETSDVQVGEALSSEISFL